MHINQLNRMEFQRKNLNNHKVACRHEVTIAKSSSMSTKNSIKSLILEEQASPTNKLKRFAPSRLSYWEIIVERCFKFGAKSEFGAGNLIRPQRRSVKQFSALIAQVYFHYS